MQKNIFKFENKLIEGEIIDRPNRFLMNVKLPSGDSLCHCPPTGKIGSIFFGGQRCLVSFHLPHSKRKHSYTVEAIKLENGEWIGINQSLMNMYLHYFFTSGALNCILGDCVTDIKREITIGNSKFDFLINDQVVEAKMFLNSIPEKTGVVNTVSEASSKRFKRQYEDLIRLSKNKQNVNVLYCYIYDAEKLASPVLPHFTQELKEMVTVGVRENVKHWQLIFQITKLSLKLVSVNLIPTTNS